MIYDNDEDDGMGITPYNAFDILESCRNAVITHEARLNLTWNNLADLNVFRNNVEENVGRRMYELNKKCKALDEEIQILKTHIYPLLDSVNNQLKILVEQQGGEQNGK